MAKRDQDELQMQARVLARYSETDLTDSQVKLVEPLLARAIEDPSLASKLLKTFEAIVDKVPPDHRITIVRWVAIVALAVIAGFVTLKVTGKW